jgi:hypothetical protein
MNETVAVLSQFATKIKTLFVNIKWIGWNGQANHLGLLSLYRVN